MTNDSAQPQNSQFIDNLDSFRQTSLEYAHDPESLGSQIVVAKAFEALVESAMAVLAAKVAAASQLTLGSAKEMLSEAQDLNLIEQAEAWIEALDYCQKLKKSDKPEIVQEVLDFSQTYFTDAVDELAEQLGL